MTPNACIWKTLIRNQKTLIGNQKSLIRNQMIGRMIVCGVK